MINTKLYFMLLAPCIIV